MSLTMDVEEISEMGMLAWELPVEGFENEDPEDEPPG